jgi:hypothetical protein
MRRTGVDAASKTCKQTPHPLAVIRLCDNSLGVRHITEHVKDAAPAHASSFQLKVADWIFVIVPRIEPSLLHEVPDELRNRIGCGIEREMAAVNNVDFSLRDVTAISFRLRRIE